MDLGSTAVDSRVDATALTDAQLGHVLIIGEPTAARIAMERYGPMVRRVLQRGLGPGADIEDAFQDVFLCMFRRVPTLRAPRSLRAFVLAIAYNTILYERRRRRKRARVTCDDELLAASLACAPDDVATSYAFRRLSQLLSRLSDREQRTFVLRVFEGRTALESPEVLGVSQPTARRALACAKSRIRKWAARDPFLLDYFVDAVEN